MSRSGAENYFWRRECDVLHCSDAEKSARRERGGGRGEHAHCASAWAGASAAPPHRWIWWLNRGCLLLGVEPHGVHERCCQLERFVFPAGSRRSNGSIVARRGRGSLGLLSVAPCSASSSRICSALRASAFGDASFARASPSPPCSPISPSPLATTKWAARGSVRCALSRAALTEPARGAGGAGALARGARGHHQGVRRCYAFIQSCSSSFSICRRR
jgi:hypothetical protein